MLTGPQPPDAVTPRLKPVECSCCEVLAWVRSFFSVTPASLYASK